MKIALFSIILSTVSVFADVSEITLEPGTTTKLQPSQEAVISCNSKKADVPVCSIETKFGDVTGGKAYLVVLIGYKGSYFIDCEGSDKNTCTEVIWKKAVEKVQILQANGLCKTAVE